MSRLCFGSLADHSLLESLEATVTRQCGATAKLIAQMAEVDARRLFRQRAYPSMHAYCVGHLHFSEEAAYKRVQVARAARRNPVIIDVIAENRVHLSGLVVLAPHLTHANHASILARATHRTLEAIREIVAELAPRPDVPTNLVPMPTAALGNASPAPSPLGQERMNVQASTTPLDSNPVHMSSVPAEPVPPARLRPLAPERFAFQVTLSQETRDLMKQAQDAVGSAVSAQDYDTLLREAFKALIAKKQHDRFAETAKPRKTHLLSKGRLVPAAIKRVVWKRDGGQCTFRVPDGRWCECKRDLEYDHVQPFARQGSTTASNLRLLCRSHNQLEAERALGEGFMRAKHGVSQSRASDASVQAANATSGTPPTERAASVMPNPPKSSTVTR